MGVDSSPISVPANSVPPAGSVGAGAVASGSATITVEPMRTSSPPRSTTLPVSLVPSTKVPFVEPVSVSSMPPSAGFNVAWRLETRGSTTTTSLPSIRPTLSSRSTSITRPASAPSRTMMRTVAL